MTSLLRGLAVMVGAVALLGSACSGATTGTGSGLPDDDVHYRWQVGDCLTVASRDEMPLEPFGSGPVVNCDQPHVFEVVLAGDVDDGEEGPYPEDLAARTAETCAAAFHDYVGVHLSQTTLDVMVYLPNRTEWAGGLRYQACLIDDPGVGGDAPVDAGSLRGAGDRVLGTVAAGRCFEDRSVLGQPIACSEPHLAESIGRFTHPEADGAPWPGDEQIRLEANRGCAAVLGDYATAGGNPVPVQPVAFARPLSRVEWEDGLRSVGCAVLVFDSDRHHAEVVGSLSEPGWVVIHAGQAA